MQVRVIPFGVLKDWLGAQAATVELPQGATVAELLESLSARLPARTVPAIAVSVNAEYVRGNHVLREGDEVGLLPPVPAVLRAVLRARRKLRKRSRENRRSLPR